MPISRHRVALNWVIERSCCMACLFFAAYDDLPTIPGGGCGNRVVDEGEACHDPDEACRPPGSPHECLVNCPQAPCPGGAGCGVEGVCRAPSGEMTPFTVDSDRESAPLVSGDFDGDGRPDVLVLDHGKALSSFDEERERQAICANQPLQLLSTDRWSADEQRFVVPGAGDGQPRGGC